MFHLQIRYADHEHNLYCAVGERSFGWALAKDYISIVECSQQIGLWFRLNKPEYPWQYEVFYRDASISEMEYPSLVFLSSLDRQKGKDISDVSRISKKII